MAELLNSLTSRYREGESKRFSRGLKDEDHQLETTRDKRRTLFEPRERAQSSLPQSRGQPLECLPGNDLLRSAFDLRIAEGVTCCSTFQLFNLHFFYFDICIRMQHVAGVAR